jgi:uncharacterized membrane protein YhaH (DUF805 family)
MNPLNVLFSFRGRIGRVAYAAGTVFLLMLAIAFVAALVYVGSGRKEAPEPFVTLLPFLVLFMTWGKLALAAKRFHDVGNTGWACLLLFLPLVGLIAFIYLLVMPGAENDNQYGPGAGAPLAGASRA